MKIFALCIINIFYSSYKLRFSRRITDNTTSLDRQKQEKYEYTGSKRLDRIRVNVKHGEMSKNFERTSNVIYRNNEENPMSIRLYIKSLFKLLSFPLLCNIIYTISFLSSFLSLPFSCMDNNTMKDTFDNFAQRVVFEMEAYKTRAYAAMNAHPQTFGFRTRNEKRRNA